MSDTPTSPPIVDLTSTLGAKSDQLNACDLMAGPIVVQIRSVKILAGEEQPVIIEITPPWKPWKPCKAMRRLLSAIWGKAPYAGRWVRLFNDTSVSFGSEKTGGIRIAAMSDIDAPQSASIAVGRKRYQTFIVQPLRKQPKPSEPSQENDK